MLCGLLLMATQGGLADTLSVDAMRLAPNAAWQRGDPARAEGVYLLLWPTPQGGALQVAIPDAATPLKTDAEAFQANLRKKWMAQYGERAEIGEIEIGGRHWLACRHPAATGDATVFQLASVYEGRAYSLIAFAPAQASGLPKPVYDLLAATEFGARGWVLSRVVTAQPGQKALEALLHADAQRLGQEGMLTGYGVEYTPLGGSSEAAGSGQRLAWFMEGFRWRNSPGLDEHLPLGLRGHLEARAPDRSALTLAVHLATESDAAAEAEVAVLDLCAPIAALDAALDQLQRGARVPLERLLRERTAACPDMPPAMPARILQALPGHDVVETLAFPAEPRPLLAPGLGRLRLISLQPRVPGGEDELGQGLLRHLGLYFVYAPE